MSLISKSAYLQVCKNCGSHAHFVYADGKESPEFASKEAGFLATEEDLEAGRLDEAESKCLREELEKSTLARNFTEVDLRLLSLQIELAVEALLVSAEDLEWADENCRRMVSSAPFN